jgi:3-keto-5-aminohexanoate cleavage enzyme
MDKLIITAGPGGPIPDELDAETHARYAIEAAGAGAAVVHLRGNWSPSRQPRVEDWAELTRRIRDESDVLIEFGRVTMAPEDRRAVVALRPDLSTFLLGHHDIVIATGPLHGLCTLEDQRRLAQWHLEYGVLPECRVSHPGNTWNLTRLVEEGLLRPPLYVTVALGQPGGEWAPPTPDELLDLLALLPPDTRWGVSAGGPEQLALNTLAIAHGGHVNVRLEADREQPDRAMRRNAEVIGGLIRLAQDLGREVATPAEARRILGLPRTPVAA